VLAAVTEIVAAWARQNNVSDSARDKFLQLLQAEWALNETIGEMGQKVWTSQHVLDGLEFCSMFNSLVRGDCKHDDDLADDVARFAHAINSNVVTRGVGGVLPWPDGPKGGPGHNSTEKDTTWRGGGFHGGFRAFFVPKKVYRVGGFLATSYKRERAPKHSSAECASPSRSLIRWNASLEVSVIAGDFHRLRQRVRSVEDRARPRASLQPRQPRHSHARPRRVRVSLLGVLGVRSGARALVANAARQDHPT
jgi:hypothetical protein